MDVQGNCWDQWPSVLEEADWGELRVWHAGMKLELPLQEPLNKAG